MAVMKAEPGYNALILMNGQKKDGWTEDNVRKIPVIAWNIEADGFMSPLTLMPWLNKSPEYLIETPDKGLIAFGRSHPDTAQYFDSLAHYVTYVREIITHAPEQPGERQAIQ